jgi:hypothetical protein
VIAISIPLTPSPSLLLSFSPNEYCFYRLIFQDHQRNRKNYRIKNKTTSHDTSKFKWFGLTSLYSLAETIHEKFSIKKWSKCAVQKKPLKLKSPIHPFFMLRQKGGLNKNKKIKKQKNNNKKHLLVPLSLGTREIR